MRRSDFTPPLCHCAAMKAMRLFLRDRLLAGASAALVAYLLVFQTLLAGMAHGAMAAAVGNPLGVICASDGSVSAGHSTPDDGSGSREPACPCATLCQFASGLAAASPPAEPALAYLAPLGTVVVRSDQPNLPCSPPLRLSGAPRAPPHLSV
jgi:hypothetical protein